MSDKTPMSVTSSRPTRASYRATSGATQVNSGVASVPGTWATMAGPWGDPERSRLHAPAGRHPRQRAVHADVQHDLRDREAVTERARHRGDVLDPELDRLALLVVPPIGAAA